MREHYNRVFFIDTENQGGLYLKDLHQLTSNDLVICVFTEHSPKFTYDQVGKFTESKAKFQFLECLAGTPNCLDFQLSSMLGYYLRMEDEERDRTREGYTFLGTEFIILSQDTGYYGIVQFWESKGYNVHIRGSLLGDNVDVKSALESLTSSKTQLALEVAANKAKLSGTENRATQKLEHTHSSCKSKSKIEASTNNKKSAIDKFNSRLEFKESLTSTANVKVKSKEKDKKKTPVDFKEVLTEISLVGDSAMDSVQEALKQCESSILDGSCDDYLEEVTDEVTDISVSELEGETIPSKEEIHESFYCLDNKYFNVLNTMAVGIAYNNIQDSKLSLSVTGKVAANGIKAVKFLRCTQVTGYVLGYIIYYSRNKSEMKEQLSRFVDSATHVNTLLKRFEQNHFVNFFGLK